MTVHRTALATPAVVLAFALVALLAAAPQAAAVKAPQRAVAELIPDGPPVSHLAPGMRVDSDSGRPLALYKVGYRVLPGTPEAMARQYLADHADLLRLGSWALDDLEVRAVRTGLTGSTVRFRQLVGGVPVWGVEVTVSIDLADEVTFVMNGYRPGIDLASTVPAVSADAARAAALAYLGTAGPFDLDRSELVVYPGGKVARLAWAVRIDPLGTPGGDWEILVDAATGEVFRAEDKALYVDGTANAFLPDPLSSALATYGDTGYVDGADADTAQLTAELGAVTLLDITDTSGTFSLKGPWAECVDWAAPFKGCFDQMSSDWSTTREPDRFEAANTYYHIDTYMRYMNVTLGVAVHPYQYPGGVQYDPAGFNGADNSSYSTGTGRLQFGEGGVDDAEDADVIIHELGHGIHDWVTMGGLSQNQGLSEGTGDYFATSYSRGFPGQWGPSDPQYNWVFSWDGHNPFWGGRVTNWNDTHQYPQDLTGQIHTDGQFWSSCNIDIVEAIGREATDRAVLVGLSYTNGGTNQQDAAQAVLQAASDLGYSGADIATMAAIYQGCGYAVTGPTEIFTDGFESGDLSAWSAVVP